MTDRRIRKPSYTHSKDLLNLPSHSRTKDFVVSYYSFFKLVSTLFVKQIFFSTFLQKSSFCKPAEKNPI